MKPINKFSISAVFLFVILLVACGGGSGGSTGSSTSSMNSSGALTLRMADGPVDSAYHVYIQFHGLEIQSSSGVLTTLNYCQDPSDPTKTVLSTTACTTPVVPQQLDLLALTGGLSDTLLDNYTLPAGHYDWIRLMVDTGGSLDSYVVDVNGDHELTIPSGDETGLKLNRGFDVAQGGDADFTLDFDLRKSIHVTGAGDYMLRPTLRMVDSLDVGRIAGTVSPSLIISGCTPAVYVYQGSNVTPQDINGSPSDPVTTATAKLDNTTGQYRYTVALLEPGNYTVAFTCQAAQDDPTTIDAITFSGMTNVTVTADMVTTQNF
ncbi:MAG: DUF4382 domain-containing protein [Sulfuricaulis sp.]